MIVNDSARHHATKRYAPTDGPMAVKWGHTDGATS